MDLRTLRSFVAIVDAGSLTRAAGQLFVAQPALTAQVKKLEAEFGVDLLERTSSGVRPTAAGQRLYEDALPLLAAADAIRTQFAGAATSLTGVVKIGLPVSMLRLLLSPVIEQTRRTYPGIQIDFLCELNERVIEAVRAGEMDFALVADPIDDARLHWRALVDEPMALFAARLPNDPVPVPPSAGLHGEYRMPTVRLVDAAKVPVLSVPPSAAVRKRIDDVCAMRGLTLNVVHEYASVAVIEALFVEGAGYYFAYTSHVPPPSGRSDAYRAIVVDPEICRTIGLARQTGRKLSPACLAVIAILRAEIASAIREGRWPARPLDRDDYQFD